MTPSLGTVPIDVARLLETRMLVQANSGSGKSFFLRRVLEQTVTHVQQIVIDPEGEFATLREKYDYIICAPKGADAVATPATASALALALWQARTSAILDIYELRAHDRVLFVRRFLEALVNAPRSVWNPALVVIDEAHLFAGQIDKAESLGAVVDLATRGRKRGLALLAATQRISKLNKDVAAELLNKAIGRTGLDVDVKRAADELGLNPREATETLRNLDPGEFFVYGPALTRSVERTKVGPVQTTHPETGKRALVAPPPPSAKIRLQLAKIEGLQRDAEEEQKTVAALSEDVASLRRRLAAAEKAAGVDEATVQRRIQEALAQAPPARLPDETIRAIATAIAALQAIADQPTPTPSPPPRSLAQRSITPRPKLESSGSTANGSLSGPERRILNAIAWMEAIGVDEPELPAVAFLAGYSYGGGAFNNPRGRLNQTGLVEYRPGTRIRLTDRGRALAEAPEAPKTNDELHRRVLERLPKPEQRLLVPLLGVYPSDLANPDLAAAAGYTPGAGAFNNPRGRLRTLGLIDYPSPGRVRARDLLFPKGAA